MGKFLIDLDGYRFLASHRLSSTRAYSDSDGWHCGDRTERNIGISPQREDHSPGGMNDSVVHPPPLNDIRLRMASPILHPTAGLLDHQAMIFVVDCAGVCMFDTAFTCQRQSCFPSAYCLTSVVQDLFFAPSEARFFISSGVRRLSSPTYVYSWSLRTLCIG